MTDTRHGHFHWNELMSRDVGKAREFYTRTLGWTYERFPMGDGGDYTVCMADGEPVGGILDMREGEDMGGLPNQWFAYIAVDDVDARLGEVRAAGGNILRDPFDVPSVGRIAVIEDGTGAAVGWITPAEQE